MEGTSSDEAEYLSCCNVCFIKFDLDQFRPKVLPCSHTFCFRCLQAIHTEPTLNCPLCRQGIELGEVAELPNNIYAQHIIQLNQKLKGAVRKELSMRWCFACNGVTKPACKKMKHVVMDMSRVARELQSKMKQSKANLGIALEKRRQLKQNLEISLALQKAQTEKIQQQMAENNQELNQLEYMLETEPDFSASKRKAVTRFKESKNVLATSNDLADEWQARLEALKWMHMNSGYSWRQRAYLLRTFSVQKNHLKIRETKPTCIESDMGGVGEKVTCFVFHPVKPVLACGFKSGKFGFFTGKNHSSPFSNWTYAIWEFQDYSITSMEYNALGNEIAMGNEKSGVMIWNTVTKCMTNLGYAVCRNSKIQNIRWNRKWAPDLLAVSSGNDVCVWDLSMPDLDPAYEFEAMHSCPVKCMMWISADKLATCSEDQIKISQLGNPTPIHIMESMDNEPLQGLWWNGDVGQLATCCFDSGRVIVWTFNEQSENGNLSSEEDSSDDSSTNDEIMKTRIMCEYYGVMCLDWYPVYIGPDSDEYDQNEGLLACGTRENLVTILNPSIKRTLNRLVGHTGVVCSVAFSPDGKYLASLSAGKELIIWSPEDNYRKLTFCDLSASTEKNISWSPCCKMLILCNPDMIGSKEMHVLEISELKS